MKKQSVLLFALFFTLISFTFISASGDEWDQAFTFIALADMRYYATEPYRNSQHFLGAVEAIKKVGPGAMMIVPGDIDPPQAVHEVITMVLGSDYPWYPAPGNHELEAPEHFEWLRQYNKNGTTLPQVVNKGPLGSAETIYSFDWANCHFVALNQYYDGKTDTGSDGNVVPELLAWLQQDLEATTKTVIFVFGHEPIVSIPDMDNGRLRHQGDSLDKYPKNAFRFHQLLLQYRVKAYLCGHTHSTSYANINGLWQIDLGHARGFEEDSAPPVLFNMLEKFIEQNQASEINERLLINKFYDQHQKQVKKTIFGLEYYQVQAYEDIANDDGLNGLYRFYHDFKQGGEAKRKLTEQFWNKAEYRKSSFVKFYVANNKVKAEIYRDDAQGGAYTLRQTILLF